MSILRKLLCDHEYEYKCSMRSARPFSAICDREFVFRCKKCDKHKSVETAVINDDYRYFMSKGCGYHGYDGFDLSVPPYLYTGNEAYAVYSRYLSKGINLKEVSE